MTRLAAGAAALVLLASLAPLPAETPVFRVGLDLVNVTVSVRDENGRLVSDLGRGDFTVREDERPQEIQVFAPAASPEEREELTLDLGMLFDTSGSMRDDLKLSQESAIRFLDSVPRARDLILIFFDRDIRISRYTSENQQGIFGRILETEGSGNTALYDAIAIYLSRVAEARGRKVLVIFSDGDDTTSSVGAADVMRLVRSSPVTIYPVAFAGERPPSSAEALRARAFLHRLAESSGGQVFQPAGSRQLASIYEKILDELASQYVLGYASDNTSRDGRYRRLAVEVTRPGLRVRHRLGYFAPRDAGAEPRARR